MFNIKLTQ